MTRYPTLSCRELGIILGAVAAAKLLQYFGAPSEVAGAVLILGVVGGAIWTAHHPKRSNAEPQPATPACPADITQED